LLVEDFPRVIPVINGLPSLGKFVSFGNRIFELVRTPAFLVLEFQPLAQRFESRRFLVMRKDTGVNNRIVRSREEMTGKLARLRGHTTDDSRRPLGITRYLALDLAHMAVLAGNALGGSG